MNLGDYQGWRDAARHLSRRPSDADDLLQDALLAALRAGRTDLSDPDTARWFHGVLRNLAAMTARTEGRRRRRDEQAATPESSERAPAGDAAARSTDEDAAAADARDVAALLARLPRGARVVAALVLHGMTREEIASALQISDTAFRQRLTVIRRALGEDSPAERHAAIAQAYLRRRQRDPRNEDLDLGPIRQALLSLLQRGAPQEGPGLGTHDPDGHLLVIRRAGTPGARPVRDALDAAARDAASQPPPPRQPPGAGRLQPPEPEPPTRKE